MKINSLEINNILSIEKALLKFNDTGLVLVEGFDFDSGRANGAGKSAIFNALSFALYDKVPRRITKSEIIRKGAKSGSSFVEVSADNQRYGIKRSRPIAVQLYKNGKEVDMTQDEFEEIIGLNYDQFLVTMYTAQDTPEKFINLNDSQKKNFILKIMKLGKFTKAKIEVSEQQKKLKQEQEVVKTKLNGYRTNINIYKDSMIDLMPTNAQIDKNKKDILKYTTAIKKIQDIKEPDMSKYIETESKIQEKLVSIQSVKLLCKIKRNELKQLQNMSPDAQCPECNTDINIVNGHLHKAGDQSIIDQQIKAVSVNINKYEDCISKESSIRELINKIKTKKQEEYIDYNTTQQSISEYRNSINLKTLENNSLLLQITKNDDIKIKVKDIINNAKLINSRSAEIDNELSILDAVSSVFDSTGAPAYVMDNIVDNFNEAVSEFVGEIWPNATYLLQTYKTNKDKSIKAKFSETLTINGKDRSIGSLSGGEIKALSLALDFAIVEVLSTKYNLSLNPIILDEPFNGLDNIGKEIVMDLLIRFAEKRQIWIIDHSSEFKANFNNIVSVEKRGGISKIIQKMLD